MESPPSISFEKVIEAEWAEIQHRRRTPPPPPTPDTNTNPELVGLALSGGGIRSATCCLGFLQAMNDLRLLRIFDYLSTVSGGGYVGAWWSAWLSRDADFKESVFPNTERTELSRSRTYYLQSENKETESSISAEADPIHHLRLFSNYLTPRPGLFSADTWRAATFISRNLLLTWFVLLPILVAIILLGQLFFVLPATSTPGQNGLSEFPHSFEASSAPGTALHAPSDRRVLSERATSILIFLRPLALVLIYFAGLWVAENQTGSLLLRALTSAIFVIVLFLAGSVFLFEILKSDLLFYLMIFALSLPAFPLGVLIPAGVRYLRRRRENLSESGTADQKTEEQWRRETYRNRLGRIQMWLLAVLIITAFALIMTGFGHELADYLCCARRSETFWKPLTASVSLLILVAAFAGLIFTWWRSAPSGSGNNRESRPSRAARFVFATTPPLTLIILGVIISWLAHELLWSIVLTSSENMSALNLLTFTSIALCFVLAVTESQWRKRVCLSKTFLLAVPLITIPVTLLFPQSYAVKWSAIAITFSLIALNTLPTSSALRSALARKNYGYALTKSLVLSLVCGIFWALLLKLSIGKMVTTEFDQVSRLSLAGLLACIVVEVFVLIEWLRGGYENRLSHTIIISISSLLSLFLLTGFSAHGLLLYVTLVLIATSLLMVIALGWMVDPNGVSMHSFYRARLIRAYLGASNSLRKLAKKDITEAASGDDLLLSTLKNCDKGAPYHIINSTLNLVGARDLVTAQRSSAPFIFSKLYCGSLRTGYRETEHYMKGDLSLGTAVAISGAAVSPNMGALKISSSLSMLLTLLNLRLGFWAPTPNRDRWRSEHVRLWPYYVFREFLSNTNDLSSYCYLTDGGHFDNTGVYSLIQRGCRFIVLMDCGADPGPCFQDLGDAIRRSRIDFGAQFHLDISPWLKVEESERRHHFMAGKIIYSEDHARDLKWRDTKEDARTGYIIVCKPSLTPSDTADVRQYGIENSAFPHQTTADQWFDEAQFESYRQLGYSCGWDAFSDGRNARSNNDRLSDHAIKELFIKALKKMNPEAERGG